MIITGNIQGSFSRIMNAELVAARKGVTVGIRKATEGLKLDWRRVVIAVGLGRRLGNTIRGQVYPRGKNSTGAAGLVFTKAPKLIGLFSQGETIRARSKKYLAIPTDEAPNKPGSRRSSTRKISPSEWPESLGELRPVKVPGKPLMLVADLKANRAGSRARGLTANQQAREAKGRTVKGKVSVVMYFLVPQSRINKKFDFDRLTRKWQNQVPQLIVANWPDAKVGSGRGRAS